jgi:hypothetical protein
MDEATKTDAVQNSFLKKYRNLFKKEDTDQDKMDNHLKVGCQFIC